MQHIRWTKRRAGGIRRLPILTRILQATQLGLLLLCAGASVRGEAATEVFPLKIHEHVLPNGLKVLVVPTGFPQLVSLQIPVQTGSRNEVEEGKTGFAHFFEHMMFRGTKAYPTAAYQDALRKMGARQNAYTSDDYTNYHTTFSKDDLELMLKLEADRFMNLEYGESEFKTEARAVLGEYNKNSANPSSKLWEVTKDAAFEKHPYKHTVMGFLKDIEKMPEQYAYAKRFFKRWYRPENTVIILAGDVDPKTAFKLVDTYFSAWQRGTERVTIPVEPAPKGPVYRHVAWESETVPQLFVSFHGPRFAADDRLYVAQSLLFELAFGETSDLYKKLVLDEQKVTSLRANPSDSKDPDLAGIAASVKNSQDMILVRDAILETARRFKERPVSAAALDAVRSHSRYQIGNYLDNTENIAALLASFVQRERRSDTLNRLYATAERVSPDDVQKAAQLLFTDANLVVSTLSKGSLPEKMDVAPRFDAPATARSKAKLPVIVQKNELPFLNIKIQFKAGSSSDPEGKQGLARFAASMVSEAGSKELSYEELQKALYPYAAELTQRVDKDLTTFTIKVHKDHASEVLDLLLPQLIAGGMRSEDLQRIKAQQLNALKDGLKNNNEEDLGKERLQELIFAGSSYAHPVLGTVPGIEGISAADLKDFYAKNYTLKNLRLAVNGAVAENVLQKLQDELSRLPAGSEASQAGIPKSVAFKDRQVDIVQKTTRATAISFGHPLDVTRSHPDFAALWLARAWLGEHRSSMSHLYERIREVRGLNYGDYAYIEAFPGAGSSFFPPATVARRAQIFEVWIRPVMPENAPMALRIALYELDQLISKGLTEEQFQQTRDYLMKNVYVMTATQDQQLGYALDSDWFGTGPFAETMRAQLQKLTVGAVNAAIKKHLSSDKLQIVCVTQDAEGLKQKLATDSVTPLKYDGVKPQELLDEDKRIAAIKLGIPAEHIRITPLEDVFSGQNPAASPAVR